MLRGLETTKNVVTLIGADFKVQGGLYLTAIEKIRTRRTLWVKKQASNQP